MESRLPKPTGLRKPTIINTKQILPLDRIRSNSTILKTQIETMPLSRNLCNFNQKQIPKVLRGSPELVKRNYIERPKLRRSRSAMDLRNIKDMPRSLKRHEPVLNDIPSKMGRFATSNIASVTKKNPVTTVAGTSRFKNEQLRPLTSATKSQPNLVKQNNTNLANKSGNITKTTSSISLNKKIPAYDYKARFADLLEKHKGLKEKFDHAKEQLADLDCLPEKYEESKNEIIELQSILEMEKKQTQCLQQQNNSQSIKITSLTKSLKDVTKNYEEIKQKFDEMSTEFKKISKEVIELRHSQKDLAENVDFLTEELEISKDQLFRANMERKELHNTIMDLRGNIRVFCRVRPPLDSENEQLLCGWNYLDECTVEISNLDLMNSNVKNKIATNSFSFDHVFHPKSTQEDVFEMVSPLIQSALDGYNICIFAYGQTGSGKTYTMDGINDNQGIIPRTVDLLFKSIDQYKRLGWVYQIKATFLEIYNEVLYDLLSNEPKEMEIRMVKNSKNDIYVSNITEECVVSAHHLRQLMVIAKHNRATAATIGNERSSRSHAVTKIELIGKHDVKSEVSLGTINLVDLAGSESPKTSIRMTETKNINRSLSELTNVILALLQKQDHIPYRNSKLTHLLMPSLGGNSKTLMFINVSPFQECYVESVKSLRFAQTVNSCKMTKAKKNKFLNVSGNV